MPHLETLDRRTVRARVHGEEVCSLVEEDLKLAQPGLPPLAIERSHLPGGPTRPPVVLVHGLAQNRFTWRVSRRSLQARLAAEGYDVWNLELRGHGQSRAYGSGNATAFDQYVADVARVAAQCGERPFLVGHSLGSAACVGAVSQVPARGFVNIAGVFSFARSNTTLRALAHLSLAFEPVLGAAPIRLSTGWAGDLIGKLYSVSDIAGYGSPIAGWTPDSMERDLLEERLAHGFDWTSVEVWLQMCRWATGTPFEWAEPFSQVDVPLLVMIGDHDVLVRRADGEACYRASGSADRTLVVLDAWNNQRHWGHLDLILGHTAPAESWPLLVDWLNARS